MVNQGTPDTQAGQAIRAQLRDTASITTIEQVIAVMQGLDAALLPGDGVKWFNLLYLRVTQGVYARPPATGWANKAWLTRLDITFAQLYFDALTTWSTSPATVPRAWAALFAARGRQDIERVQFALGGMNAHINHDLPLALMQTSAETGVVPDRNSPEYRDFEAVNGILSAVEPEALQFLATGIIGVVAQDLGTLGNVLAMWSVQTARDTAWTNAELLWQVRGMPAARDGLLLVLDRMTGFAGRGLLLPV
jgi:hypothetical protein